MTASPRPHRSIGVMVAGSLVSACCGVVLTFFVPRFLSVDDFGVWRTFLLYAGYAGLLHLGLVDGALLLWSRGAQPDPISRSALGSSLRFVAIEHAAIVAVAAGSFLMPMTMPARVLLLALSAYALLFNLTGLLQVYLQAGLRFGAVAFGLSGPSALFVLMLGGLAFWHVTVSSLLVAYLFAWMSTMAILLAAAWRSYPTGNSQDIATSPSAWRFGLSAIAAGWPIVLANTGFGLMQSADRVTVNLTRPLHDFAIYSLSQSTIYVPIAILAAITRVAFSYFARAHKADRASLYGSSTRLLALIWMLLLPYFFVVEVVVRRFLPRYVPGLAAGRILLLSVLFLSLIQVVQLNTYSLEGRQRQFFIGSLIAVAMAFGTAWIGSIKVGTLTAVAWSQVLTAGLWWLGNEWFLRDRKLLRVRDIFAVLATFAISATALFLASIDCLRTVWRPSVYYGIIAIPICFLFLAEAREGWNSALKLQSRFMVRR